MTYLLVWIGWEAAQVTTVSLSCDGRVDRAEPANVTLFSFPLPFNFQTDSYRVLQNIVFHSSSGSLRPLAALGHFIPGVLLCAFIPRNHESTKLILF